MRVIGVLDLADGSAVHARRGERERYRPVEALAGAAIAPGDAVALARAYIGRFGLDELYAADLDAILGRAPQDALIARLVALGAPLWLDAGAATVEQARSALGLGAARVIVGLETLPSFGTLQDICAAIGGERVAFSLDLHGGAPIFAARTDGTMPREADAPRLAAGAAAADVGAVIVIDLVRVGADQGPDFELIARVREAVPDLTLIAGGGVRGPEDLARLEAIGCDGALVATALHDGRLGAADIAAIERRGAPDAPLEGRTV